MISRRLVAFALISAFLGTSRSFSAEAIPPIPRVLPPEGIEIPADVRARLEKRLAALRRGLPAMNAASAPLVLAMGLRSNRADVEVFLKAVEYALAHREFYTEKDFQKADWALDEAEKRLDEIGQASPSWKRATGLVVRGFYSEIDSSAQPYGLVIPENHDFTKPCPLYVWLHGRGDKSTDLHFLYERATRRGKIEPPGAIVLHVFGRQCVGYKAAGEVDVHEAVDAVRKDYRIDSNRLVLIGFSMGGAGAWQVGAHSAGTWAAISPGAGFAETARYQRLSPENVPSYERTLWGVNDVPNYVRNLFNTEVIAYSGELDRQIQAARVMEEAYQAEGRTLTHLIGPGVEHEYQPETLKELLKRLDDIVRKGRDADPDTVHLQTRTLRYASQGWILVGSLVEHWLDSRVDARRSSDKFDVQTRNISRFAIWLPLDFKQTQFVIDGQSLGLPSDGKGIWTSASANEHKLAAFVSRDGKWHWDPQSEGRSNTGHLAKGRKCQGPIDDAFNDQFLVVTPSGKSKNAQFQAWVEFELDHLRDRWRALMRGELPEKRDVDFNSVDESREINLVLFGDPDSNSVMAKMLAQTPARFQEGKWSLGPTEFSGSQFVPAFIYPRRFERPNYPNFVFKYVVFNSGLTFREGHDRTNSLQNPKLPDWAVIDITQAPDALAPGRIHDAGFFDEEWKLKAPPKAP